MLSRGWGYPASGYLDGTQFRKGGPQKSSVDWLSILGWNIQ
jgi:hypothetical protein